MKKELFSEMALHKLLKNNVLCDIYILKYFS